VSRTIRQCVLILVKAPERGRVKTRLAVSIGQDGAVDLYRRFVEDLLTMLDTLGVEVACCYQPAGAEATLLQWLGCHRRLVPQRGVDLGQRMQNAFRYVFEKGMSRAVLIGSDSPDLAPGIIEQALDALQTRDAVIGPSSDGGYYLLGFTAERFLSEVFEDICWSTDCVCDQTLRVLDRYERDVFVLPQWHDIDTRSDLDELIERNRDTEFRSSHTLNLIRGCGWDDPEKESTK